MITTYQQLPNLRQQHPDERIVFGGGVYDVIHEGHVAGLAYRKSLGSLLVVGVVSDERARQRKGSERPIRNEIGRLLVVDAFRDVDYTFIMPLPTPEDTPTMQVLKSLRPDVFADHYESASRWEPSRAAIEALGTKLVYDEGPKLDSTTDILARMLAQCSSRTAEY